MAELIPIVSTTELSGPTALACSAQRLLSFACSRAIFTSQTIPASCRYVIAGWRAIQRPESSSFSLKSNNYLDVSWEGGKENTGSEE